MIIYTAKRASSRKPSGVAALAVNCAVSSSVNLFFFNDTATTEIYTLSLHDALPISLHSRVLFELAFFGFAVLALLAAGSSIAAGVRSEEHTSELQSHVNLVCRLLLEKKKKHNISLLLKKKKKTKNQ